MIKHIRISNYKSLGWVSVDLAPITVLIGQSGTGKTNFVEALRFLRDCVLNRIAGTPNTFGGWQRIMSATAPRPMILSFVVRFDVPGQDEEYQYTLAFQQPPKKPGGEPALEEEKLAVGNQVLFHQKGGKWLETPKVLQLPAPGSLMLGGLTGFREVTVAFLVLGKGLGWYAFPDDVLHRSEGGGEGAGLTDNGANFIQALNAITTNLQDWGHTKEMVAALRHLKPSLVGIDLEMPNRNKVVVSHEINGKLLTFDLDQESEGFRRFLAYQIALYQTPPKQTLIFEEPEKGIHPAALEVLADQFKACPSAGRGQVILTTHSPTLLDFFPPESLRVVEMENYVTSVRPVTAEQVEAIREQLLQPGELLTIDPARGEELQPSAQD